MCCGFDCCCCGDGDFYVQCRLKKKDSEQVSWISAEFAVPGKVLKIRGGDGGMVNGWVVMSAGKAQRSGDALDAIMSSQLDIAARWSRRDALSRHLQARMDSRYTTPRRRRK